MFFIMGIYDKQKEIPYSGGMEICSECGEIIDRDLNAAINLANYSKV